MKLLVVILNYRTTALAIDCLRSLETQIAARGDARVVVVDNGSGDEAEEQLLAAIANRGWSLWAGVMALPHNVGFSAGNNAAMAHALASAESPEYVLLLNSDTALKPGAIDALVGFMDTHPTAGIAGSRLEYPSGGLQGTPFRFIGAVSEFDRGLEMGILSRLLAPWAACPPKPDTAARVDWVAGASMILRRAMVQAIGLLDERFFAYFEDMDYCLNARRKGWETWYVPESRVIHLEGASSGIRKSVGATLPEYWFDARRRYFSKNYGFLYAAFVDTALIGGCMAGWLYAIVRRRSEAKTALLGAAIRHSVFAAGLRCL